MAETKTQPARSQQSKGNGVLHRTKNDLPKEAREQLIQLLNERLADALDLRMQCKQAHWNVKGPHFIGLHKLFDDVHDDVSGYSDLIAERAVMLGGNAYGTVEVTAKATSLPAYPLDIAAGLDHVEALSTALAAFGKLVRAAIERADELGDQDTADLFTEVSRGTDQWLWFVEAHLQAES